MSEEFQIERHKTLWEEKTKQAKRIVYLGLLFSVLIFVNVLTPYSKDSEDKKNIELKLKPYLSKIQEIEKSVQPLNERLQELNLSSQPLNEGLQHLNELEKLINNIEMLVEEAPWETETQKLIEKFREMNISGGAGWDEYQAEADNTIYSVAVLVKRKVVEPLSDFLDESSTLIDLSLNLVQELETISKAVNNWVKENIGKRWYRTIESKRAHIESVSNTLDIKFKSVLKEIYIEKPKLIARLDQLKTKESQVKTKMNQLETEMNQSKAKVEELKDKSKFKDNTEKLEQIQAKMDKILPEWLQGMISVEQMVQTFPFAVVFLIAYALSTALAAASHYRVLVRELNLQEAGFTDPNFSSLWALTYRGRFGTLLTIGVYTVFTLVMWFFFESGSGILSKLLETRDAWFINKDNFPIIFWLCRMIMVLLISYIFIRPYYIIRKIQSAQAK